jgi:hypothetical protein
VICRNNAAARLICDQLFAPGTWTVAGATGMARVSLSRRAVVYARGTARLRSGHVVRVHLKRLRPIHAGRYRLTLRLHSHGSVIRITRAVRIR